MRIHLEIDTGNAAFGASPSSEIARILRQMAHNIDGCILRVGDEHGLRDYNGNKVGRFWIEGDDGA